MRVYDLDSGMEKEVYKGHHGPVHCVSYSPDGEMYASGSEDGEFCYACDTGGARVFWRQGRLD